MEENGNKKEYNENVFLQYEILKAKERINVHQ